MDTVTDKSQRVILVYAYSGEARIFSPYEADYAATVRCKKGSTIDPKSVMIHGAFNEEYKGMSKEDMDSSFKCVYDEACRQVPVLRAPEGT
jgi:hypothetical protein